MRQALRPRDMSELFRTEATPEQQRKKDEFTRDLNARDARAHALEEREDALECARLRAKLWPSRNA